MKVLCWVAKTVDIGQRVTKIKGVEQTLNLGVVSGVSYCLHKKIRQKEKLWFSKQWNWRIVTAFGLAKNKNHDQYMRDTEQLQ